MYTVITLLVSCGFQRKIQSTFCRRRRCDMKGMIVNHVWELLFFEACNICPCNFM